MEPVHPQADTADDVELITHAPRSGIWRLDPSAPGGIRFVRRETDWHTVASEDEAFYLRIAAEGQYRYPGADLGILVTRGRLQTDEHELTERAHLGSPGSSRSSRACRAARGRAPGAGALLVQDAVKLGLTFDAIEEATPGPKWQSLFERHWPRYRPWFLHEGERARASYAESLACCVSTCPSSCPRTSASASSPADGDLEARMLSMWRPPSYLSGCSQGVWTRGEPVLVRNYDYSP